MTISFEKPIQAIAVREFALWTVSKVLLIHCAWIGSAGWVYGQQRTESNHSIPASSFSVLRPMDPRPTEPNRTFQQRIIPIAPPQPRDTGSVGAPPLRGPNSPMLPASNRRNRRQEFLEDVPETEDPDSLLPAPKRKPQSSPAESILPAPIEEAATKNLDDDLLLPSPMGRDEARPEASLLEQREKSVTPYPKPDFSTPAERVAPVPIQRAPEDFKGFEPESPGDWNLPEPRRTFPLPKVEAPAPPSLNLQNTIQSTPMQGQTNEPRPMPWQGGSYSASPQFQSLLGGSKAITLGAPSVGPIIMSNYESVPHSQPMHAFQKSSAPYESLPFRERLESKRWQLANARQLYAANNPNPLIAEQSCLVPYQPTDFAPVPYVPQPLDPQKEIQTYYGKSAVDTQRPWVEWWRPFYTGGMYEPGVPVFSDVNLLTPSFLVYGDYRTGVGVHRDKGEAVRSWAHRLNLDMDLRLTGTERFHMFTGPLDHNGRFTRLDFSNNNVEFEEELDFQMETAFFEGDLGSITGSLIGDDAPFDLPFTCGLVPLLYQNGIWMEDAIAGFAFGAPWKHSRALNWSNYEATFFAGFSQVTSPAFNNDDRAAAVYGTAWFIEAYNGYIEADYAYLDDLDRLDRSYHNAAIAYTRRYFGRISNSIRLIGNIGQSGPANDRSADGALLLFENSLISSQPSTVVPYWNCFVGSGRPQSVARAANAGGILRNTGINFETDALTNYPTLNATGSNSYGGAFGLQILSSDFRKQWVTEFAALDTYGDPALSAAAGPEYAIGTRYQTALNNRIIWRVDLMNGWFDNAPDIYGTRTELRWKF